MDTLGRVRMIVKDVTVGHVYHHKLVGMLTFNMRNAFNSAPWPVILEATKARKVPAWLMTILDAYLTDRAIDVSGPLGEARFFKEMSYAVLQGSVLGPDLWNLMYDNLLRIEIPSGGWAHYLYQQRSNSFHAFHANFPRGEPGRGIRIHWRIHPWLAANSIKDTNPGHY